MGKRWLPGQHVTTMQWVSVKRHNAARVVTNVVIILVPSSIHKSRCVSHASWDTPLDMPHSIVVSVFVIATHIHGPHTYRFLYTSCQCITIALALHSTVVGVIYVRLALNKCSDSKQEFKIVIVIKPSINAADFTRE